MTNETNFKFFKQPWNYFKLDLLLEKEYGVEISHTKTGQKVEVEVGSTGEKVKLQEDQFIAECGRVFTVVYIDRLYDIEIQTITEIK